MTRTWNFRILAKKDLSGNVCFEVYEVHYENDKPLACTENSIKIFAEDDGTEDPIESIQWQLDAIKKATEKPVLNYDDFPKEYIKYTRRKKLQKLNEQ